MTSNGAINKPFSIEKRRVYEAYKAAKPNRGAALGWMDQTLEMFETDLEGNLYKSWNRMLSRTYFASKSPEGISTQALTEADVSVTAHPALVVQPLRRAVQAMGEERRIAQRGSADPVLHPTAVALEALVSSPNARGIGSDSAASGKAYLSGEGRLV